MTIQKFFLITKTSFFITIGQNNFENKVSFLQITFFSFLVQKMDLKTMMVIYKCIKIAVSNSHLHIEAFHILQFVRNLSLQLLCNLDTCSILLRDYVDRCIFLFLWTCQLHKWLNTLMNSIHSIKAL